MNEPKGTTFMCPHCKGCINNQNGLICTLCGKDVTATSVAFPTTQTKMTCSLPWSPEELKAIRAEQIECREAKEFRLAFQSDMTKLQTLEALMMAYAAHANAELRHERDHFKEAYTHKLEAERVLLEQLATREAEIEQLRGQDQIMVGIVTRWTKHAEAIEQDNVRLLKALQLARPFVEHHVPSSKGATECMEILYAALASNKAGA